MRQFDVVRAGSPSQAARLGAEAETQFIAGGTNLVDLLKDEIERPAHLVDINGLDLGGLEDLQDGGLRLGALATNADTAYDRRVAQRYPVLSTAILAGASAQLRNVATNGGNLNQRTRCYYFYDPAAACNKRRPGAGCAAIGGVTRVHAILGASPSCIATHPSDMCVALAALEAKVHVTGQEGSREIPLAEYHRLPGDEPCRDNVLRPGDLVTAIDLPREGFAENWTYLKLRDRLSYAFALVSIAVVMRLEDDRIAAVRIALGAVAHKPWRRPEIEQGLLGQTALGADYGGAARALLEGAEGQGGNDFKIDLALRGIVRACRQAAAGTPQSNADKRVA